MRKSVEDFLGRSPAARAAAQLDLGAGRTVTVWENRDDRVRYEDTAGHTFSLYLRGGTGTRRLDAGAVAGWPGAVCVMPEGHRSEWVITTPFRFVHLYLPDQELRSAFAATHDCDARRLDLREATFVAAPPVAGPLMRLAHAARCADMLLADAALADLIAALPSGAPRLRGGLTPAALRRVDDWIAANLESQIRLADLARLAALSEFHFHRMFRMSRGATPQAWVAARRIDRAKAMLRNAASTADIAAACGFSSRSHLTRAFRKATGRTPSAYRAAFTSGACSATDGTPAPPRRGCL